MPDPGRRLTPEEQKADPEKRAPRKSSDVRHPSERDERACKNARIYYQLACGAPDSRRAYSRDCAEANVMYEQNCR